MNWRGLHLSEAARLSVKQGQLLLEREGDKLAFPLEDMVFIMLDATRFRKFLIDDGYTMLQFSVYMRICRGQDMVDAHMRRLEGHLPEKGSVRALQVTEQQYARMKFLVGKETPHDKPMEQGLLLEF